MIEEGKEHKKYNFSVGDVSEVYSGPGGKLWELLMGEQIHVGGADQTDVLAEKIGLDRKGDGLYLLDICSALGGPARHLAQRYGINMSVLISHLRWLRKQRSEQKEKSLLKR